MNVFVARYGYELFPGKRWMGVVGCECFSIRAWLIVGDCDYLTGCESLSRWVWLTGSTHLDDCGFFLGRV